MKVPYYRSERVTLYHGDAARVLPELDRESMDLLVTDPPYGVEWRSDWRATPFAAMAGDEAGELVNIRWILERAIRLLRRTRHAYVFGPAALVAGLPLASITELVWDKGAFGPGDLSLPYGPAHEPITFGTFYAERGAAVARGGLTARLRKGSVLRVNRAMGLNVKRHPTEKPVALLRQLVESSSTLDEVVLDPFAGSGSSLVAAVLEGRRAVGVELDEEFCALIVRRVRWAEALAEEAERDGETEGALL